MVNNNACGKCKPHLNKFGGLFGAPENSPEYDVSAFPPRHLWCDDTGDYVITTF